MDVPWFAKSPSPFSIIFYFILAVYIMQKLLRNAEIKRFKHLIIFTDSLLLVGFFVVTLDLIWIAFCYLRFGAMYPDSVFNLAVCAGRNVAAIIFCYMLTETHFKNKLVKPNKTTWVLLILNFIFLSVWFYLSPTPAWTDWTFAIRHDYPLQTVVTSFIISHIMGKGLVASIIYTTTRK